MSAPQTYILVGSPELTRILNDLKAKLNIEDKEKPANELRNAFQRNIIHSDEVYITYYHHYFFPLQKCLILLFLKQIFQRLFKLIYS